MQHNGLDVVVASTGHDVADARLHRICGALAEAGLRVGLEGLGDPVGGPAGVAVRARPRPGRVGRLARALALPAAVAAPVLVVVDPELAGPGLAWRRARPGRRLVVDVHEDYAALLADRAWSTGARRRAAAALVAGSVRAAARADLTVVADDHVPPLAARARLVVRNLPRPGDLPPPGDPDPEPRALYVGDVRPSRGLAAMVDAVLAAPPWRLDIVGPIAPSDAEEVRARAGDRVRLHGRLPPRRAWALAGGAWAGLALLDDTPAFRDAVPTKCYEYLGSGLAVLATPLPRVAALLERSGAGAIAAGATEAGAVLRRWAADPGALAGHRAAARRWADRELTGRDPFTDLAAAVRNLLPPANIRN